MLKREITRIGILGGIGLLVMLFVMFGNEDGVKWSLLIIPVYFIGMFYAGKKFMNWIHLILGSL